MNDNNKLRAENYIHGLLFELGQNTDREGLLETPKRYVKFLDQFLNPDSFDLTQFVNESENSSEGLSEMVIVKDIPFYSLCEHHLAPFFGVAHVGYIPDKKIIGLSKIPRVVDKFSRKLQNQERLTDNISGFLMRGLSPHGVAVVVEARHLCMEMRGIKAIGASTTTSSVKGRFKTEVNTRQEFLNLIRK